MAVGRCSSSLMTFRPEYASRGRSSSTILRLSFSFAAANSVVRHQPVRYRTDNNTYGFRNPGHLARVAEYYPPDQKFDNPATDPIHPATFNEQTTALSRGMQIQAYNAGTARYNAVMQSIYAYSRPMGGFGFGGGFF